MKMNIEEFDIKKKIEFLKTVEYKFAIRSFRFYISLIYQILESVCGEMVYYPDGELNYSYTNLKLGLDTFLSREDFKELAKDCPPLPESLFGDVLEYECYWETEQASLLSFLGVVDKEFIVNGYPAGILPEEKQIADSIQELCYEHSKTCKQGFAKMEENIDKTFGKNNASVKKQTQFYHFDSSVFTLDKSDGGVATLSFPANHDDPFYLFTAMIELLREGSQEKNSEGIWLSANINRDKIIELIKKNSKVKAKDNDWSSWIRFTKGNLIKKINAQSFTPFIRISNFHAKVNGGSFNIKIKLPIV